MSKDCNRFNRSLFDNFGRYLSVDSHLLIARRMITLRLIPEKKTELFLAGLFAAKMMVILRLPATDSR